MLIWSTIAAILGFVGAAASVELCLLAVAGVRVWKRVVEARRELLERSWRAQLWAAYLQESAITSAFVIEGFFAGAQLNLRSGRGRWAGGVELVVGSAFAARREIPNSGFTLLEVFRARCPVARVVQSCLHFDWFGPLYRRLPSKKLPLGTYRPGPLSLPKKKVAVGWGEGSSG